MEHTTHKILHILRNPYSWTEDEKSSVRLAAADKIEQLEKVARLADALLAALAEFDSDPAACSESAQYLQDALDEAGMLRYET